MGRLRIKYEITHKRLSIDDEQLITDTVDTEEEAIIYANVINRDKDVYGIEINKVISRLSLVKRAGK